MHQSIILVASPARDIDDFIEANTPRNRQLINIEDHVKSKGVTRGIFIEDIRELRETIKTSGSGREARVVVLRDAGLMNDRAQNAFLKHLEEPDPSTTFILVTPTPQRLLETVRSRCVLFELTDEQSKSTDPQIAFISRGKADEVAKLTKNKSYLKKRTEVYSQAKVLVGGSQFDKLKLIVDISSKRPLALEVITAALHIIQVQIKSKYNPSLIKQAERLTEAYDRIEANGNVKLQLLASVV